MISYDPATAAFRGEDTAIHRLRDALAQEDGASIAEILAEHVPQTREDAAMAPLRTALLSPMFTVEVTVSGPGARHDHHLSLGVNAVGARISPLREGTAELAAFPLISLPGGITRLVRFRPGTPPPADAAPIPVAAADLLALTDPDGATRRTAWDAVRPRLDAALPPAADDSWQVVEVHAAWTTPSGEQARDHAVHLRRGDDHLLVEETEGEARLLPVTSLRAWESMMHVLPEQGEVAPPR
ncbi:hypothetical protein BF93_12990 [Brachybacterium phenoliresistens]|uniref:ESX secretion-associated protein EspG n=1 Tax=Brachybacterium phenoliresistens TaxID=396014 RepID=Z9JP63_9MICO|nr:hypothetical protein [Brachybacterium phenoliresistens]EWS79566.1 hypothetical protein BF93_12990 [Brachybacterium phenoliresistens]